MIVQGCDGYNRDHHHAMVMGIEWHRWKEEFAFDKIFIFGRAVRLIKLSNEFPSKRVFFTLNESSAIHMKVIICNNSKFKDNKI